MTWTCGQLRTELDLLEQEQQRRTRQIGSVRTTLARKEVGHDREQGGHRGFVLAQAPTAARSPGTGESARWFEAVAASAPPLEPD